ncbi:ribulose-phosphate 3-epimerase [Tardisphaera miroshnichenkoae]
MNHKHVLSASILDIEMPIIWERLKPVLDAGLQWVHLDIVDGHFVPNITYGPRMAADLRTLTDIPLEAHLMVTDPEQYMNELDSKVNVIYFHYEAARAPFRLIQQIHSMGLKAGIALSPRTSEETVSYLLPEVDYVLVMLTEPGYGNQQMIGQSLRKIKHLKKVREREELNFIIAADGGIKLHNIDQVLDSGAEVIIVGSGIFKTENPVESFKAYNSVIEKYNSE